MGRVTGVDVGEDVGEYLVGFSLGDGEVVEDEIGEFDLAHGLGRGVRDALILYGINQKITISISVWQPLPRRSDTRQIGILILLEGKVRQSLGPSCGVEGY